MHSETHHDTAKNSWHWHSSPITAEKCELSILALLETSFAVSIYIWLAIEGYTIHLITSACIAPFLLLRTPESVKLALYRGENVIVTIIEFFYQFMDIPHPIYIHVIRRLSIFSITTFCVAIGFFCIRCISTYFMVIHKPIKSINSIPRNWWRIVGCVDSAHI